MMMLAVVAICVAACVSLIPGVGFTRFAGGHDVVTRLRQGRMWQRLSLLLQPKGSAEAEVPSMLDIITLGLEAGLSFDASLELYCERYEGLLAGALKSMLMSWRLGVVSRSEGLARVAKDIDAPSLVEVAEVVDEALELGLPLAATLTRQADALRASRRFLVEERIEGVPVKMLIPLGTLIVPAMLLAILGPLLGAVTMIG